jgi:hypothetical protein
MRYCLTGTVPVYKEHATLFAGHCVQGMAAVARLLNAGRLPPIRTGAGQPALPPALLPATVEAVRWFNSRPAGAFEDGSACAFDAANTAAIRAMWSDPLVRALVRDRSSHAELRDVLPNIGHFYDKIDALTGASYAVEHDDIVRNYVVSTVRSPLFRSRCGQRTQSAQC